ncbi:uncharacterized protein MONOS_12976 [Monocercomonoides exilis]|uniref:uncharacterized protein n=1 Tax=Monocercomonoides exilis TaxID=2049356 RepID=UPI0035594FE5|nr:hypothetical protein MONOS_12976 [Monocercomonoides exilis]|eukprot:MONOS_12976.1-p1 / transcript=MONOS_12976.1 / gene=MONOS_12976 / organism=Monocercomonoides_exilis_PA203 / gene_product=unspecified product / transcript_product=unspecified product / location=Mono_scaffold00762:6677-7081(+) / protein_length=113 / sequence_SO=supercontig / SO=protein_coding / is_pseudo=false
MFLKLKDFFRQLEVLFSETQDVGSINLIFKRLGGSHLLKALKGKEETDKLSHSETRCIIHAKTPRHKISTIIPLSEVINFQAQWSALLKEKTSSMYKMQKQLAAKKKKTIKSV